MPGLLSVCAGLNRNTLSMTMPVVSISDAQRAPLPWINWRGTVHHGLPLDLFISGEARWLGVQPEGQPELPRTLFVSVPYALSSANAETFGGKPTSAFVLAGPKTGKGDDGQKRRNGKGEAFH